jgi:hypothetical protein
MFGFKPNNFTNPKACAVNGFKQDPVLLVVDAGEKRFHLLHTENCRQLPPSWTRWQTETVINFTVTYMPVKIGDARQIGFA